MNRSTSLLLIAVALAGYGVYAASCALALGVASPMPGLLVGFVLQAVCAFAAAFGTWRGGRWAIAAVLLLGVIVAGTWLFEAFILGLVAYLHALLVAAIALLVTLVIAGYLSRQGSIAKG
jgi:hypothetical protein